MRVTSKGQVTIPRDLRVLPGIEPNSDVIFSIENGRVYLEPKEKVTHAFRAKTSADSEPSE